MSRVIILVVGLLWKSMCGAMGGQVPYDRWDSQAKAIIHDIVSDPTTYEDKSRRNHKLTSLLPFLPKLQGGAYRVYCEFLEQWQTGDSEEDFVPDKLDSLAAQIYNELLNG